LRGFMMAGSRVLLLWFTMLACLNASSTHPGDAARLTLDQGAVVRSPRDARRLALVFTADLYAEGASTILDTLREGRIKASFFLTGRFLRNPAFRLIVARLRDEGHLVGPHSDAHLLYASWDHPPRLLVTHQQFQADLTANLRALESHQIDPRGIRVFLPAYEHHTEEIARWSREAGLTLVNNTPGTRSQTDYMTDDDPHFTPAARIVASILDAERAQPDGLNGYLLLMHLGAGPKRTRDHLHDRLGAILDELTRRGYRFARVNELLGLDEHSVKGADKVLRGR
ncbi:MAG: polysaccharide deacetylase family protein, partial [Isosphaeraceae bacterium]